MTFSRAAKYLILAGIFLSPVNGLIEYFYTLGLDLNPWLGGRLMWLQKGLKDGMLLLVLLVTGGALLKRAKVRFDALFLALLGVCLLAFGLTLAESPVFAFIGVRSLLPLLLFMSAAVFLEEKDLALVTQVLTVVVAIVIPLALLQLVYGTTVYDYNENGRTFGRFASRIFATFSMPGSFGIFLLSFIMFSALSGYRFSGFMIAVSGGLLVLTGSGMSLVALMLFSFIQAFRMIKNASLKRLLLFATPVVLPFAVFAGYYLIPVITGRVSIWNSPLARLQMMTSRFDNLSLFELLRGDGLGYCTNAAFNLLPHGSEVFRRAAMPESLYLSLFSQIGLIGGALFIALNARIYLQSSSRYRHMIPVFMFTGLTMNLLELFPVNWLYMLLLGVCAKTVARPSRSAEAAGA